MMTFKEMLDFKFQNEEFRNMLEDIVISDIKSNYQNESFGCEKCYDNSIAREEKRLGKKYEDFSEEESNEIDYECFHTFLRRKYKKEKIGGIYEKCDAWEIQLSKAEVERCKFLENTKKCEICGKTVESLHICKDKNNDTVLICNDCFENNKGE